MTSQWSAEALSFVAFVSSPNNPMDFVLHFIIIIIIF